MTKIHFVLLYFSTIIVCSCGDNTDSPGKHQDTAKAGITQEQHVNDDETIYKRLIWGIDLDTIKGNFFLVKKREVNADTLTPQKIISEINAVWPNIFLQFKKISNDTIYVAIPKSEHLTQRMGTSGAANYMASTTYNLTELTGIKYVNFDFEEGDHLAPGTMTREDYKIYIK